MAQRLGCQHASTPGWRSTGLLSPPAAQNPRRCLGPGRASVCVQVVITRQMQSWGDDDVVEMLTYMDVKLKEGVQVRRTSGEQMLPACLAGMVY